MNVPLIGERAKTPAGSELQVGLAGGGTLAADVVVSAGGFGARSTLCGWADEIRVAPALGSERAEVLSLSGIVDFGCGASSSVLCTSAFANRWLPLPHFRDCRIPQGLHAKFWHHQFRLGAGRWLRRDGAGAVRGGSDGAAPRARPAAGGPLLPHPAQPTLALFLGRPGPDSGRRARSGRSRWCRSGRPRSSGSRRGRVRPGTSPHPPHAVVWAAPADCSDGPDR